MPFKPALPPITGASCPSDGITISTRRSPKGLGSYAVFTFGAELLKQLKWSLDLQYEVAWGEREDRHKARIMPTTARPAFRMLSSRGSSARINVSDVPHDAKGDAGFKHLKVKFEKGIDPATRIQFVILTMPVSFFEPLRPLPTGAKQGPGDAP